MKIALIAAASLALAATGAWASTDEAMTKAGCMALHE